MMQPEIQNESQPQIQNEIQPGNHNERLLTPREVASRFHVDPKTVTRWAQEGRLTSLRTLGGHRRYFESEVTRLLGAR